MTTLRTAPRRGAKTAASIAALLLLPLSLTACGGGDDSSSSLDGEYYSSRNQLLIEDNAVSVRDINGCSLTEEPSAQGTLSDDGTQIIWGNDWEDMDVDGNDVEEGTSPISVTTADKEKVVSILGVTYQSGNLDDALDTYNADFGGCD